MKCKSHTHSIFIGQTKAKFAYYLSKLRGLPIHQKRTGGMQISAEICHPVAGPPLNKHPTGNSHHVYSLVNRVCKW